MSLGRAAIAILAASILIGAAMFFFVKAENMPKLEVTFIVSDDLARKGGVVFVLPRKIDRDEFVSRYPTPESGLVRFTVDLTDPVTFAHFDTPGRDYSYRFQRIENRSSLDEHQMSIGGAGTIYLDKVGDPVFAELSMRHYIYGAEISLSDANGLEYALGDFNIGPENCRQADGVVLCTPDPEQVRSALFQSRQESR